MAQASAAQASVGHTSERDSRLFWGCFIALVSTSFGFIARVLTAGEWGPEFGLTATQVGEILGAGLWPFAISIILFSLVIDKIGYKVAMWFGFACHITSAALILVASDYSTMYLGAFVLALGSGTVEAYINPVVATAFTREKTKWLNILHAGWPGGLALGGILIIVLGLPWRIANALIVLPSLIYVIMLATKRFPVQERVASGVSYRDMLREVGAVGFLVISALVILQIGQILGFSTAASWGLIALLTIGFGVYTRSPGRPLFIAILLIMFPLATTELGVDSWVTTFMSGEMGRMGLNPGWVLIYTSIIMVVLRFFAGGLAHRISPLGLLTASSAIAAAGLFALSSATGAMVLFAATLYALGKTFFWPTTLAVAADQFPRGGAMTLNAVGGVGMLAVGIAGAPFMGYLQDREIDQNLAATAPALHQQLMEPKGSIFGQYEGLNTGQAEQLPAQEQQVVAQVTADSQKDALRTIAILPIIMFLFFGGLALWFRSRGGYRPAEIAPVSHQERKEQEVHVAATQA